MPTKLTIEEMESRWPDLIPGQLARGAMSKYLFSCPVHGTYKQRYSGHNSGNGCTRCGKELSIKEMEAQFADFIKGQTAHGTRGLYLFLCPIHGTYEQSYRSHVEGVRCPRCSNNIWRSRMLSGSEKLSRFSDIEPNQIWRGSDSKYWFVCRVHGRYKQRYQSHAQGRACIQCGRERAARKCSSAEGVSDQPEYITIKDHFKWIFKASSDKYLTYKGMPFCDAWNPDKDGSFLVGYKWIVNNLGKKPGPKWTLHVDPRTGRGFQPGNIMWAPPKIQSAEKNFKIIAAQRHEIQGLRAATPPMRWLDPKPLFATNMLCPFGVAA